MLNNAVWNSTMVGETYWMSRESSFGRSQVVFWEGKSKLNVYSKYNRTLSLQ